MFGWFAIFCDYNTGITVSFMYLFNICCVHSIFEIFRSGIVASEGKYRSNLGRCCEVTIHRGLSFCMRYIMMNRVWEYLFPLLPLTNRVWCQTFRSCQCKWEMVSQLRFSLYFFYYEWGRACFHMFVSCSYIFSWELLILYFFHPIFLSVSIGWLFSSLFTCTVLYILGILFLCL